MKQQDMWVVLKSRMNGHTSHLKSVEGILKDNILAVEREHYEQIQERIIGAQGELAVLLGIIEKEWDGLTNI